MFKNIISIFALCLIWVCVPAHAQKNDFGLRFDRQAFVEKRNAYITAELKLTLDEAAVFIPLCNELQRKLFGAELNYRKRLHALKFKSNLTEEDYRDVVECGVEVRLIQARLEKEYFERFKKVLSYKQLYNYRIADENFMKKFFKEYREKMDNNSLNRKKGKN